MDFHRFEQLCSVSWPSWSNPRALAQAPHPSSRDLHHILAEVPGMATENKIALLNHAVACLEQGEVYVEIGCWRGTSLIGAMTGNSDKHAYACDNFSEFGGPREAFHANVQQHRLDQCVEFFDLHYEDFLRLAPWGDQPVGVYFYDGGHSFKEQYIALEMMLPHLADRALVIVDDTNALRVRRANRMFTQRNPSLSMSRSIRTPGNEHPTWWNGVEVFEFRRAVSAGAHVSERPAWFDTESMAWDVVEPIVGNAYMTLRRIAGRVPGARALYRKVRGR